MLNYSPIPSVNFKLQNFSDSFQAILDNCSSFCLITVKAARKINWEFDHIDPISIKCGNGSEIKTIGKLDLTLFLGDRTINHTFHVVSHLISPIVIGSDLICKLGIVPNLKSQYFYFEDNPQVHFQLLDSEGLICLNMKEIKNFPLESPESKIEILIDSFPTVCRTDGIIGQTDFAVHKIEAPDFPIHKETPRFFNPTLSTEIQRQVDDLLKYKLIRPSTSPYGFNIVLSKKKDDNKWRMTINYKNINKITVTNAAPMHKANVILRLIPTGGWYSKIDLKSGFWQIKMHPSSIQKTAFYANGSLY